SSAPVVPEAATETEPAEEIPTNIKRATDIPHTYTLVNDEESVKKLVAELLQQKEIAFDTETTNIDANLADIVGMSFSWKQGEAYYVNVPAEKENALALLEQFRTVFEKEDILWVG